MQIQSQLPATDPTKTDPTKSAAAAQDSSQTPGTSTSNIDGLANESTFLQLLVAQIKNQDPLQPTDGVQFLSQLAQFSQLEQLIGIRQELGTSTPTATDPTKTPATN